MTYTNFDLVKDEVLTNGQRGLVARCAIRQNAILGVFGGPVRAIKLEGGKIPDNFDLSHVVEIALDGDILYAMEVGAESETQFGLAFMNHSCRPNVGHRDRVVLYALRDIAAAEPLTIDYRTWDWIHEGIMCWCDPPNCLI
ncbi:MAG: SET domain-containing protein [Candidatus Symbiobacter sp.]|nr:SET domain-containing protein [Candidatus Symbiobacter sp.]